MNVHHCTVLDVEHTTRRVIVQPDQPVACSRCAAGRGCGAGLTTTSVGNLSLQLASTQTLPVVGERVHLAMADGQLLRAALIVYGLPLLTAVIVAAVGSLFWPSDAVVAALALVGLGLGFLLARWQSGRRCRMPTLTPL